MNPEPPRIVQEPSGSVVLVGTPWFRSRRFASLADYEAYNSLSGATLLPMLVTGLALTVAKFIVPDESFVGVVLIGLLLGFAASTAIYLREGKGQSNGVPLSWEESVALDPTANVTLGQVFAHLGRALMCLALLALVAGLIASDWRSFARKGLATQLGAGVFGLALLVGTLLFLVMAYRGLRFRRLKG